MGVRGYQTPLQDGSGTVTIELPGTGASVVLWPERAVSVPSLGLLLIADTHFGKSQTLRRKGVPVPPGVTAEVLDRLGRVVGRSGSERVIVLGDLLHAPAGMTESLIASIGSFVGAAGVRVELVAGNHDSKLRGGRLGAVCAELGIELLGERVTLETGGPRAIELVHDAEGCASDGSYRIGGHLHPAVVLRGGGDAVKLPAALIGEDRMVLPAFSSFVGGVVTDPVVGDRVFAVADHAVIELPTRAQRHGPLTQ